MREQVPEEATCPICGRHFDPSESRGWCPNPSCGEWQHPLFPLDESASTSHGGTGPPSHRSESHSVRGGQQSTGESTQHDETADDDGTIEECPDCGADLSGIPSDRLSTCPICLFDLTPIVGEQDEPAADEPADHTTSGSAADEPADHTTSGPAADHTETEPAESHPPERDDKADADIDPASAPVDELDGIADGYARRLADADVLTVGELVDSDPDTLSAKTGISARRISGWIDNAPVDSEDVAGASETAHTGGETAQGREEPVATPPEQNQPDVNVQETRIQPPQRELVFEVGSQEIPVRDGETVGREIRNAMVETGGSEDEAVYIHRKHIRVDEKSGEFFITRLGKNSLSVNGRTVDKGDRVPVEDGDEVDFSNVVTARVSIR